MQVDNFFSAAIKIDDYRYSYARFIVFYDIV